MNPFKFGTAVIGKYFIGRDRETDELLGHVTSSQNVLIFGDRKTGKTSLLLKLMTKLPKNYVPIYVDLWGIKNTEDFCKRLLKSIEKIRTFKDKMQNLLKVIKSLRPTMSIDDRGSPVLSYSLAPGHQEFAVDELMTLLGKLVGRKKSVIIFDEFQEINAFDKRDDTYQLKGKLRSIIQFHQNISYIYCGSQRHVLMDMFDNKNEPFYESALKFPLRNIPLDVFIPFIKGRFSSGGKTINDAEAEHIYEMADGVSNNVQQLCYFVFGYARDDFIGEKDISGGLQTLLDAETPSFLDTYRQLSKPQQNLLRGLATTEACSIYTKNFISTFNLNSTQAVRDAVNGLINKNIIFRDDAGKHSFKIIWFRYWIQNMEF